MKERRAYIRFYATSSLTVKPEDGTNRTIKADLVDIGYIGLGVHTKEKIAEGAKVKFELVTKLLKEPIVGDGLIVYAEEIKSYDGNEFRVGIEFVNVDKKAIISIINHIHVEAAEELKKKIQSKMHPRL